MSLALAGCCGIFILASGLNLPLRIKSAETISARFSVGRVVPLKLNGRTAIGLAESIPSVMTISRDARASAGNNNIVRISVFLNKLVIIEILVPPLKLYLSVDYKHRDQLIPAKFLPGSQLEWLHLLPGGRH